MLMISYYRWSVRTHSNSVIVELPYYGMLRLSGCALSRSGMVFMWALRGIHVLPYY